MMGGLEDKMTGQQDDRRTLNVKVDEKKGEETVGRGGEALERGKSYVIFVITIMSININFH